MSKWYLFYPAFLEILGLFEYFGPSSKMKRVGKVHASLVFFIYFLNFATATLQTTKSPHIKHLHRCPTCHPKTSQNRPGPMRKSFTKGAAFTRSFGNWVFSKDASFNSKRWSLVAFYIKEVGGCLQSSFHCRGQTKKHTTWCFFFCISGFMAMIYTIKKNVHWMYLPDSDNMFNILYM